MDLAKNLQLLEVWGDPVSPQEPESFGWFDVSQGRAPAHGSWERPLEVSKAASLVQFAGTSHFHVLTEVFGRLWLLRDVLKQEDVRVVVPKLKGFLSKGFKILTKGLEIKQNRFIEWTGGPSDVMLRLETLYYANWLVPMALGQDGGHCPTPASILRGVRSALTSGSSKDTTEKPAFVFIKRKGEMRSVLKGEKKLVEGLQELAASHGMDFVTFESLKPSDTLQLFARARVVLGVHGAGLTNLLFCTDALVFELGFASPFAGHYRYLSKALGLRLSSLSLRSDARGMAAREVEIDLETTLRAVRMRLREEL